MTSDQGTSRGAELQLGNSPVTPKSHGLNPNANIFHSKTPAPTSVAGAPAITEPSNWEGEEAANVAMETDGYSFMNGDVSGKNEPGADHVAMDTPSTSLKTEEFQMMNGDVQNSDLVTQSSEPVAGSSGAAHTAGTVQTEITNSATPPPTSAPVPTTPLSPTDVALDASIPPDQLRTMLKDQLEYYFSRDNLAGDSYLVSQMDADQYVPIITIASFNLVKRLTSNMDLIVDVLRESSNVQVDEKGEKVRPLHKRCIVILREIPDTTPLKEVKALFSGANCPRFVSCEFAHNNSWYVTFDSDEDAQRAYKYLREEIQTFLGKPIMARIKAKPLLRSTFMPKNGFKPQYSTMNQYTQSQPTYSTTATSYTPPVPSVQYINSQPQQGQRGERSTIQHLNSQPQQSFPYFHQQSPVLPAWHHPTSPPYFDPGMVSRNVFAVNGYQPQGFKVNASGRHAYQNMRNSSSSNYRNQNKPHNRNQNNVIERSSQDSRQSHDRHSSASMHRSSPRGNDLGHSSDSNPGRKTLGGNHGFQHPSNNTTHMPAPSENNTQPLPPRHSDGIVKEQPPLPKRSVFKSRRRREDDGAKTPRQSSSQASTKEAVKPVMTGSPKFELESNSFPPLPGSTNSTTTGDVFENKMSDVVKGTAKPLTRDAKPQVPQSPQKEAQISTPNVPNSTTGLPVSSPPQSPKKPTKSSSTSTESDTKQDHTLPSTSSAITTEKTTQVATTSISNATTTTSTTATSANSQPSKSHHHTHHSSQHQPKEQSHKSTQKQQQLPVQDPEEKPTSSMSSTPARLTYAQMTARGATGGGKGCENGAESVKSSEESEDNSDNKPQALKEQSQVSRSQNSAVKTAGKGGDFPRKDRDEPKEQRVSGRRAKENRERRERDKRRERPRSPTK